METNNTPQIPILNAAWKHYAELDAVSSVRTKSHLNIRRWIAVFGILATVFAVLTQFYPQDFPVLGSVILKFFLITTPIAGSVIAAYASKKYSSGDWLALRAGAEGIQREIYIYRTILQKTPDRRAWLEKRLADIQRQVYRSLGGKLIISTYKGSIPPYYRAGDQNSDPGFQDLTGEAYYQFRLRSQLAWHIKKVNQFETEQTRLTVWILIAGAAGTVLAGLGSGVPALSGLTLWVAVSASFATALMGWEELRNLDVTIKNYSKVRLELDILAEHWENLEPEERSDQEFFQMVRSTEEILWSQNVEYIKSMQEALASIQDKDSELIEQALQQARQADVKFKESLRQSLVERAADTMEAAQTEVQQTFKQALDTIAQEAASEEARQEMTQVIAATGLFISQFQEHLKNVAAEFAGVELTKETPKETLHTKLSKYPVTGEVKG